MGDLVAASSFRCIDTPGNVALSIVARAAAWYAGRIGSRDSMDRLSPVQTNADNHGVNRSRGLSILGHHNVNRRDSVTPDVILKFPA